MVGWQKLRDIISESLNELFPTYPFHLIGKTIDSLTLEATFSIKAKRTPTAITLTTSELIMKEKYLLGLSPSDRQKIFKQHLLELERPEAYIFEFPIAPNDVNQNVFKILLLKENKIVCGKASWFINNSPNIITQLSPKDVIALTMAYYQEKFLNNGNTLE